MSYSALAFSCFIPCISVCFPSHVRSASVSFTVMVNLIIDEWNKISLSEEEQTIVRAELVGVSNPDDDARLSLLVFGR